MVISLEELIRNISKQIYQAMMERRRKVNANVFKWKRKTWTPRRMKMPKMPHFQPYARWSPEQFMQMTKAAQVRGGLSAITSSAPVLREIGSDQVKIAASFDAIDGYLKKMNPTTHAKIMARTNNPLDNGHLPFMILDKNKVPDSQFLLAISLWFTTLLMEPEYDLDIVNKIVNPGNIGRGQGTLFIPEIDNEGRISIKYQLDIPANSIAQLSETDLKNLFGETGSPQITKFLDEAEAAKKNYLVHEKDHKIMNRLIFDSMQFDAGIPADEKTPVMKTAEKILASFEIVGSDIDSAQYIAKRRLHVNKTLFNIDNVKYDKYAKILEGDDRLTIIDKKIIGQNFDPRDFSSTDEYNKVINRYVYFKDKQPNLIMNNPKLAIINTAAKFIESFGGETIYQTNVSHLLAEYIIYKRNNQSQRNATISDKTIKKHTIELMMQIEPKITEQYAGDLLEGNAYAIDDIPEETLKSIGAIKQNDRFKLPFHNINKMFAGHIKNPENVIKIGSRKLKMEDIQKADKQTPIEQIQQVVDFIDDDEYEMLYRDGLLEDFNRLLSQIELKPEGDNLKKRLNDNMRKINKEKRIPTIEELSGPQLQDISDDETDTDDEYEFKDFDSKVQTGPNVLGNK